MTRDMELVRKILLKVEENTSSDQIMNLSIEGYDNEIVYNHCKLIYDAGLVSSFQTSRPLTQRYPTYIIGTLTWAGHDFLDKIKSDSIWDKTKTTIKKKGLPLIFETIKSVASAIISSAVEGAVKGLK